MKKIISLLLAFVMATSMMTGCFPASDSNMNAQPSTTALTTTIPTQPQTTAEPTQPTTVPTQPEVSDIELECELNYLLSFEIPYLYPSRPWQEPTEVMEWPAVIRSQEKLQELAKTDLGKQMGLNDEIVNIYDDAFFAEKTLILICFYKERGDHCYQLKSCMKMAAGYYMVTLEYGGPVWGPVYFTYVFLFVEVKDVIPMNTVIYYTFPESMGELIRK
jgi:hypothetical protein